MTDHIQKANGHLDDVGQIPDPLAALVAATVAQTHATLALAEEQRTANLLALQGLTLLPDEVVHSTADEAAALDREVRERLGYSREVIA